MYLIQLLYKRIESLIVRGTQDVLDKGHTLKALGIDRYASQLLIQGLYGPIRRALPHPRYIESFGMLVALLVGRFLLVLYRELR